MNLRAPLPGPGWLTPAIVVVVLAGAGCGGSSSRPAASTSSSRQHIVAGRQRGGHRGGAGSGAQTIPDPGPTGIAPASAAVRVIRAWSSALARGDVQAAANYFALPSEMINGPDSAGDMLLIRIRTRAEAVAANAGLPCGARFISADQRGRYVNALFALTNRPGLGGGCDGGAGQTARTNLVIKNGRIVEWIRAPDDPGDNGSPPSPAPGPTAPQTTGPTV